MKHLNIFLVCLLIISIPGYGQAYAPEKGNTMMKVKPVPTLNAYTFNLQDVRLTDGPFLRAMEADKKY